MIPSSSPLKVNWLSCTHTLRSFILPYPIHQSSPGGASHAISVGSTRSLDLPVQTLVTQPAVDGIEFFGLLGSISWTFEDVIENAQIFFSKEAIADPSGQTE